VHGEHQADPERRNIQTGSARHPIPNTLTTVSTVSKYGFASPESGSKQALNSKQILFPGIQSLL
jgi:hypothetical protein